MLANESFCASLSMTAMGLGSPNTKNKDLFRNKVWKKKVQIKFEVDVLAKLTKMWPREKLNRYTTLWRFRATRILAVKIFDPKLSKSAHFKILLALEIESSS